MNYMKDLEKWKQERDEALLSMNVPTFRRFYNKWLQLKLYEIPLPGNDKVVMATICQGILALANPPEEKAEAARKWLREHNMSDHPWR